jgi:membrane protein implicated in regulation of membrane protease activity
MIDFLSTLQWWHWFIAAAALGIVEGFVPGAVAIWFAVAAACVGVVVLAVPIPWQVQLVLFGGLSIAALGAWRAWKVRHPETSDLPQLNRRASQYIGTTCVLSEPIVQGYGKAQVGDGYWKVSGPDLPAGAVVRVRAVEGTVLIVETA